MAPSPAPETVEHATDDRVYSWLLLMLLFAAYLLSLMDRMLLALLIEPIKASMALSDTGISIVQGLAFMLLYTFASIPLGRLVDRSRRTTLVGIGIAVWSFATAACGLAAQAWQLFMARLMVGVGEATLMPAAYSLLPDSFSKRRLGLATGIFALGGSLGLGMSLIIGGYIYGWLSARGALSVPVIGRLEPWQQTFIVVGLPGLILSAILIRFPEPGRKEKREKKVTPWSEVFAFVKSNRAWLIAFHIAACLVAGLNYMSATWIVSMLVRSYGIDIKAASALTGPVYMIACVIGTVGIGFFSDLAARGGGERRLYVCTAALVVAALSAASYPLVNGLHLAIGLWGVTVAAGAVVIGAGASNFQEHIPGNLRGVMTGIFLLIANTIAFAGLGTLVALVSDHLFPQHDGLRYALALVGAPSAAGSALFFFIAGRYQKRLRDA